MWVGTPNGCAIGGPRFWRARTHRHTSSGRCIQQKHMPWPVVRTLRDPNCPQYPLWVGHHWLYLNRMPIAEGSSCCISTLSRNDLSKRYAISRYSPFQHKVSRLEISYMCGMKQYFPQDDPWPVSSRYTHGRMARCGWLPSRHPWAQRSVQ